MHHMFNLKFMLCQMFKYMYIYLTLYRVPLKSWPNCNVDRGQKKFTLQKSVDGIDVLRHKNREETWKERLLSASMTYAMFTIIVQNCVNQEDLVAGLFFHTARMLEIPVIFQPVYKSLHRRFKAGITTRCFHMPGSVDEVTSLKIERWKLFQEIVQKQHYIQATRSSTESTKVA